LRIFSHNLASFIETQNQLKGSIMKNHVQHIIGAVAITLGILSQAALAQTVPPVPAEILLPAGNSVYLKGSAAGTQNYVCLPSDTGFAWKFLAPQATLSLNFRILNRDVIQQISTHFLSANPVEGGTPRPTWQSSLDTSSIWGKAVASSTNPAFVAPGAIPWLLLQIVGAQDGPMGGSLLSETTYIHRVNTSGGVAPSTGCSAAANVGALALVPYTTDYYFYKASR
jgi:hypothetical protein